MKPKSKRTKKKYPGAQQVHDAAWEVYRLALLAYFGAHLRACNAKTPLEEREHRRTQAFFKKIAAKARATWEVMGAKPEYGWKPAREPKPASKRHSRPRRD
jgi:hypothetical protein